MIRFAKALQSKERQREETTMRRIALASTTLLALCTGTQAADQVVKSAFFLGADYQAGYEHVGAAIRYFKGKAIGPVYTPLTQLDFAPEIARIRAEKPDAVFAFLVGAGGVAFVKQYAQAGLQHQLPFYTEDPVANPLTFPAQGDAALGVITGTNLTADLDT